MDPKANIEEQKSLRAGLGQLDKYDRSRLRDLVDALRGWQRGGGFAPEGGWAKARKFLTLPKFPKERYEPPTYPIRRIGTSNHWTKQIAEVVRWGESVQNAVTRLKHQEETMANVIRHGFEDRVAYARKARPLSIRFAREGLQLLKRLQTFADALGTDHRLGFGTAESRRADTNRQWQIHERRQSAFLAQVEKKMEKAQGIVEKYLQVSNELIERNREQGFGLPQLRNY